MILAQRISRAQLRAVRKMATDQSEIENVLDKAGLKRPLEALFVVPARAEDCRKPIAPDEWSKFAGQRVYVEATIAHEAVQKSRTKPGLVVTELRIGGTAVRCEEFGYLAKSALATVAVGTKVCLFGIPRFFERAMVLTNPSRIPDRHRGGAKVVYPRLRMAGGDAIGGLVQMMLCDEAIGAASDTVRRAFPLHDEAGILRLANRDFRRDHQFETIEHLFHAIHTPGSPEEADRARRAASMLSIGAAIQAARTSAKRDPDPRSVINIAPEVMKALRDGMPFKLNDEQTTAVRLLWRSLKSIIPSDLVVMGEVASGKTPVYGLIAAGAQQSAKRVAILIPNSVLQLQVAESLRALFPMVPFVEVRADVKPTDEQLANNPVLVGTHALNTWAGRTGWKPDLVIVDEQQKLAVDQRQTLVHPWTNKIEASATVLPRTLGLALYGDLGIAILSKPAFQKKIKTQIVGSDQKRWLFERIREAIAAGCKAAVILPAVNPRALDDGADSATVRKQRVRAIESAAEMWEKAFPGRTVVLHGKLKDEQKRAALELLCTGSADLCLASSIIEIGVNVPRLTVMVVVEPDRLGVSTLHQMRGRLAREGGEGACYLYLPDEVKPETRDRLQLLERYSSGIALAEHDMAARGFGDLSAESEYQSGSGLSLFHNVRIWPKDIRDAMLWADHDTTGIVPGGDPRSRLVAANRGPARRHGQGVER